MNPETRNRVSTLWIVIMFSMVYADVLTMHIPEFVQDIVAGTTDVEITEGVMLGSAVLIAIPIIMIYLSRVLGDTANRRANIAASTITTVFVVGGAEFVAHYYFFAAVQLVCLSLIVKYVWHRPAPVAPVIVGNVYADSTPGT